MLLRCVARPLFASWFVVEAVDQIRHPGPHATAVREGIAAVRGHVGGIPGVSDALDTALTSVGDRGLRSAVQLHGAVTLAAAAALAMGKAPRTAGLALALFSVPIAVASLPAGKVLAKAPDEHEAARRRKFWSSLSGLGGALLAAGDLAGRPGMAWRVQAAHEARAAARDSD